MEFVRGRRPERFGETHIEQLRPAGVERIEAGDVCAALCDWIGIVLRPVVEKIVSGDQAEACVGVEPVSAFVVAQSLGESRSGESTVGIGGRWNVLQKVGARSGPRCRRDRSVGKDAAGYGAIAGAGSSAGV